MVGALAIRDLFKTSFWDLILGPQKVTGKVQAGDFIFSYWANPLLGNKAICAHGFLSKSKVVFESGAW